MLTLIPLLIALNAVSHLLGAPGLPSKGEVALTEKEEGVVTLVATFEGLTPGRHMLQLHAEGCSTLLKSQSAGAHFNPLLENGCDASLAILEIGELEAKSDGKASLEATLEGVSLSGSDSLIGYSLVIHPVGLPALKGAKASPLACGIIEKSKE